MSGLKVLVVTGLMAKGLVEEEVGRAEGRGVEAVVVALPRPVAALFSLKFIASELKRLDLKGGGFDVVLIPGMVRGDASTLRDELGVPAFKGPKHAADLAVALEALAAGEELSTTTPACELLKGRVEERGFKALEGLEASIDRGRAVKVGRRRGVWVGGGAPLRVFAEVLDAPLLGLRRVAEEARRFKEAGADVVDLGMLSEDPRPQVVRELVRGVRRRVGGPVSIDTLDEAEVVEALKAGVDAVLSLTPSMAERGGKLLEVEGAREAAYVLIPFEPRGRASLKAEDRVEVLMGAVRSLREAGARRVIVDPLVDPPVSPGCLEAFKACQELKARMPDVPVMLGLGNVTELMDADSHGVNALLAALAVEAGASALLTTEGSDKTRGCVEEAVVAARMASLALARRSPPKDLGFNLLRLKEKRRRSLDVELPRRVVEASSREEPKVDPAGSFRLGVDERRRLLIAVHYPRGSLRPDVAVVGRGALEVRDALIQLGLVSDLRHAFYLGYELAKAEVALKLGRSYVQDEDVV